MRVIAVMIVTAVVVMMLHPPLVAVEGIIAGIGILGGYSRHESQGTLDGVGTILPG